MRRALPIGLSALAVSAAAVMLLDRTLWVNGKKSVRPPIEHEGEIYVPITALKEAGAQVTMTADRVSIQFTANNAQNQVDAVEGVVGEFVSNEVWRIKITKVETTTNPFVGKGPGIKLKFEARNVSDKPQSLHGSGMDSIEVFDNEGRILAVSGSSFKDRYTTLPPGGPLFNDLLFGDPRDAVNTLGTPEKVLILFKSAGGKKLKNIRILLSP